MLDTFPFALTTVIMRYFNNMQLLVHDTISFCSQNKCEAELNSAK
jgi:hypothetical protein